MVWWKNRGKGEILQKRVLSIILFFSDAIPKLCVHGTSGKHSTIEDISLQMENNLNPCILNIKSVALIHEGIYTNVFMFKLSLLTHGIRIQLCGISCFLPKPSKWLSTNVLLLLYIHWKCLLSWWAASIWASLYYKCPTLHLQDCELKLFFSLHLKHVWKRELCGWEPFWTGQHFCRYLSKNFDSHLCSQTAVRHKDQLL